MSIRGAGGARGGRGAKRMIQRGRIQMYVGLISVIQYGGHGEDGSIDRKLWQLQFESLQRQWS